jgi:hypothetical protein
MPYGGGLQPPPPPDIPLPIPEYCVLCCSDTILALQMNRQAHPAIGPISTDGVTEVTFVVSFAANRCKSTHSFEKKTYM